MNNKITFPELVDLVAQKANTSKRMSEVFLKEFFATISSAMIEGESVKVKGLGTFKVTAVKERSTRSVNDGGVITIPDHNKVSFVPDPALARIINMPFEHFEVVTLNDEVTDEQLQEIDNSVKSAVPEVEEQHDEQEPAVQQEIEVTPPAFVVAPPPFEKRQEQVPPVPQEPQALAESPQEELSTISTAAEPPTPVPPVPVPIPPVPAPVPVPVPPAPAPVPAPPVVEPPVAPAVPQPMADEPVPEELPESAEPEGAAPPVNKATSRRSWWHGFLAGALSMLLLATIVGLVSHCGTSKSGETEVVPADSLATSNDSAVAAQGPVEQAVSAVTDTVTDKKEDWPVNIAKRHYGHEVFWVYIYLENKDILNDYMKVPSGTVLVIPPAEKYGIDASDPASIKKAQDEANHAYIESQK